MKRFTFIKNIALMAVAAMGATSCSDWLTLYPQDRVVEENFWEDKNDLEGVRYAAYQQMCNTLEKLIIWGDLRSDAYNINPAITSEDKSFVVFQNITEAKLDSTMTHYDWGSVYTTINFCNKVLQHGEEVLEKDAQFTRTEWNELKAEMTALRALNYFYLLRAFKDIPYTTQVINTDEEVMDYPATNQPPSTPYWQRCTSGAEPCARDADSAVPSQTRTMTAASSTDRKHSTPSRHAMTWPAPTVLPASRPRTLRAD